MRKLIRALLALVFVCGALVTPAHAQPESVRPAIHTPTMSPYLFNTDSNITSCGYYQTVYHDNSFTCVDQNTGFGPVICFYPAPAPPNTQCYGVTLATGNWLTTPFDPIDVLEGFYKAGPYWVFSTVVDPWTYDFPTYFPNNPGSGAGWYGVATIATADINSFDTGTWGTTSNSLGASVETGWVSCNGGSANSMLLVCLPSAHVEDLAELYSNMSDQELVIAN